MRITNGSDPVFDKLVTGKDKYLFNLLYRIRDCLLFTSRCV